MAEVAISWSCNSPWVTAPIVGVRSTDRLDELIKGMDLKLSEEETESINKLSMSLWLLGVISRLPRMESLCEER